MLQLSVLWVLHSAASLAVSVAPSNDAAAAAATGGRGAERGGCAPNELPISTVSQTAMTSAGTGAPTGTYAADGVLCMPYASDGDEMKHNPSINDTLSTYVLTHR